MNIVFTVIRCSQDAKAALISPTPGAVLYGATQTFTWTTGSGALEYFFYLGTGPGLNNLYGHSQGTATTVSLPYLPANGSTVYVRLWTRFAGGWQFTDYSYISH